MDQVVNPDCVWNRPLRGLTCSILDRYVDQVPGSFHARICDVDQAPGSARSRIGDVARAVSGDIVTVALQQNRDVARS